MHIDRNFVDAYDRRRGHAPPLLSGNLRRLSKSISQRHEAAYPDDPPPKSPFDIMLFIPTDLTDMLDDHFISWSDWRLIKLVEPATFIDRHTRTDREYRFQP